MAKKIIGAALFIFVIFLFCYFRLKPLYFQTVGYTYDQGRDFLKAAEIIRDRNITFIGPTTGIQGLFHGAWYYYLLVIPYLLFNGSPIGYYYFNFILHLFSLFILMFFIKKWFGSLISLLIGAIIASSPYFIFTSLFVGNNIFVLPLLVLFIICNYYIFNAARTVKKTIWFWAGLLVALIFEFEVAFGLFLLPSYILILLLNKNTRKNLSVNKGLLPYMAGLIIPFVPRILFEIKNNFMQSKVLVSFFFKPKIFNPRTFNEIILDRVNLFWGYFKGIFSDQLVFSVFLFTLVICLLVVLSKLNKSKDRTLGFFSLSVLLLFVLSLFYKDNFWGNYYEGIQYLFLVMSGNILYVGLKKVNMLSLLIAALLIIVLVNSANSVVKDWSKKPERKLLGNQLAIVDYISDKFGDKDREYCVKVYTPPVIPYTYRYLFLHKNISKKIPQPKEDWVKDKCWFIIENDDYKERRLQWLDSNIPKDAKVIEKKTFLDVDVALYEITKQE
ncbi:hypothetical protein A3A74_05220 [Candidatus Roizmanbacteria bacterium RIFCSPLOWO2_01_FULL_35_13]|uniref:Uncharacterized protein n=1 Tax=Candidatus Roizmanbacteria bacterium RIFCSPLOWO2_01_FULL_35_13 TaxID=1802055 RepID=A0A1F7I7J9_9BACT|nr:MAG: hypothetical protein A3A74_05220 [Candidatus Roizmanbacteria bacterium RIFCSPLOWO2_01_FULL_35_13]